jgi:beta-N-acetylhexosaminidase
MRTIASWRDPGLARRIAACVGGELAALGFTIDFAPVLDVNTAPRNPVIGDRAFGDDPATCALFGAAWVRGLQEAGVLACGKHFPGHGDTTLDSHLDLPVVDRDRAGLLAIDLHPFREAATAGVASLMTAHVVYPALDPTLPATLSRAVCTDLRAEIGFEGMLVSDDLEMKAIADRHPPEEAAVLAIAAGCDALLICHGEDHQEQAVDALVREAEDSPAFRARCESAARRVAAACASATARALDDDDIACVVGGPAAAALSADIARRMGA